MWSLTAAGVFDFTIPATAGATVLNQSLSITIDPAPVITTVILPDWTRSVGYSQTFVATGGTGALTFTKTAGTRPAGLTLNASAGVLSGTPTTAGLFSFTIQVTDSVGAPRPKPTPSPSTRP